MGINTYFSVGRNTCSLCDRKSMMAFRKRTYAPFNIFFTTDILGIGFRIFFNTPVGF